MTISELQPFLAPGEEEYSPARFLMELAQESRKRGQNPNPELPTVRAVGLKLGRLLDLVRGAEGISWVDLASSGPRHFNPVYLALLNMGLIRRDEVTEAVLASVALLVEMPLDSLRKVVEVVEDIRELQGLGRLFGGRPQGNILAPLHFFARAIARGQLGGGAQGDGDRQEGEFPFPETGIKVNYWWSQRFGLTVEVSSSDPKRRLPGNCQVSLVSAEGSVIAGPTKCQEGVARLEDCPTRPAPEDSVLVSLG